MARPLAVVLVLALVLVPAISAQPVSRGESAAVQWLGPLWDALNRVFSWLPSLLSGADKHGAYIVPDGVRAVSQGHGAYIVPDGIRSAPQKHGAYIVPDGIRSGPELPEDRRPQVRDTSMRR